MILTGHAHKFGHDISTDLHVFDKHTIFARPSGTDPTQAMAAQMLGKLDPGFAARRRPGDFIVAGRNFGTLSMYDQAAEIIQAGAIAAVIAQSFDVLFFRHAVNRGLLLVEADTTLIETGDELEVDVESATVRCPTKSLEVACRLPHPRVLAWLREGGVIEHLVRHGRF